MSCLKPFPMPVPYRFHSQEDETRWRLEPQVFGFYMNLLREDTFSDVTFIVGPSKERIPCHQLFLRARSPVFEVMFSERWKNDRSNEVVLDHIDPKIFKKFVQFVYSGTFAANVPEALKLLEFSHMYDVHVLVGMCEHILYHQVTLEDAVNVFQAARKYDKVQLMNKVGTLLATSLAQLQRLPSFSLLDKHSLMYILGRNDLKMKEVDLFRLALQWATNQSDLTLKQNLEDILPLIRFPLMTLNDFKTTVVPTCVLPKSTVAQLFAYFASDTKARKSVARTLKFSTQQRTSKSSSLSAFVLYSGNMSTCKIKRQRYEHLRECIRFTLDVMNDEYNLFRPLALFGMLSTKKIYELSRISFYCPATTEQVNGALEKKFKILVKGKSQYDDVCRDLRISSPVKCLEGNMSEVEFDPGIPMVSGMLYYVIVEEIITSAEETRQALDYEARDFGNILHNVTTSIGDKVVRLAKIQRNRPREFKTRSSPNPQLIYKLGLREW